VRTAELIRRQRRRSLGEQRHCLRENPVPPKTATVGGALIAAPLSLLARARPSFPVLRLGDSGCASAAFVSLSRRAASRSLPVASRSAACRSLCAPLLRCIPSVLLGSSSETPVERGCSGTG
jgi:hypothetical protein